MNRYAFLEFLVRLSHEKYASRKKSYPEALTDFLSEYLFSNQEIMESWKGFREKRIWTLEVDDFLCANEDYLSRMFEKLSQLSVKAPEIDRASYKPKRSTTVDNVRNTISFEVAVNIMTTHLGLSLDEAHLCFGMSK